MFQQHSDFVDNYYSQTLQYPFTNRNNNGTTCYAIALPDEEYPVLRREWKRLPVKKLATSSFEQPNGSPRNRMTASSLGMTWLGPLRFTTQSISLFFDRNTVNTRCRARKHVTRKINLRLTTGFIYSLPCYLTCKFKLDSSVIASHLYRTEYPGLYCKWLHQWTSFIELF